MVVLVTCKNKNESVNSDIIMLSYSLGLVTSYFYQYCLFVCLFDFILYAPSTIFQL